MSAAPVPRPLVIVPARDFRTAKSRLGSVLSAAEREALARRLLGHVVATLREVPGGVSVVVATDAPAVATFAASLGASALLDPPGATLTGVVRAALERLSPGRLRLVCMADLPWLTLADVEASLAVAASGRVGLAPDHTGRATNLLALPAGRVFPTFFGLPDSLARHRAAAHADGSLLSSPGLERDLDTPEDWARWAPAGS